VTHVREPLPTDVSLLPPLPPEYHAVVDAGLATLGLTLGAPIRRAIDDHVRLLLAWTEAINLTAIRDPVAVALEHVLDSLSAVGLIRDRGAHAILDLGSGGGFPGLPLALATPAERTLLVESVGKKATFLGATIDALRLRPRVAVAATRAETLAGDPRHRAGWPIVTARAVAGLPELIELALPLIAPGGALIAWKRHGIAAPAPASARPSDEPRRAEEPQRAEDPLARELAAGARAAAALGGSVPVLYPTTVPGLTDHVLVVVEKWGPTPGDYPRDPAVRKRRPW
jgi:16S rRNA (guanine527-N7)-methyltransferase